MSEKSSGPCRSLEDALLAFATTCLTFKLFELHPAVHANMKLCPLAQAIRPLLRKDFIVYFAVAVRGLCSAEIVEHC